MIKNEYGIKTEILKVSEINLNTGQVEGLPKNPRFVKDKDYEDLIQSLKDNPEMKYAREVLVIEHENKYVTFAGNTRLRAFRELKIKEIPCKIFPADFDMKKIRAIAIKDNRGYGNWDWDIIANEWDTQETDEWGINAPEWNQDDSDIDLDAFFEEVNQDQQNSTEESNKNQIILEYSEKDYEFVKNELLKHGNSYEDAVYNLISK